MFDLVIPGITSVVYFLGLFALSNILKTDQIERKESLILVAFIGGVILLDVLNSNFIHFGWLIQAITGAVMILPTAILLITGNERSQKLDEQKRIIAEIVKESYSKLNEETLDVKIEHGKIAQVSFSVGPNYIEESSSNILKKIALVHPGLIWDGVTDLSIFKVTISSYPQAPWPALYPGSALHPWNWLPLGLSHKGELGWNLGATKEFGRSSYVYSDNKGKRAATFETPRAPQGLIVGSTGGGKAIALNQSFKVK